MVALNGSLGWFTVTRDGHNLVSGECLGTISSGARRRDDRLGGVVVEAETVAFEVGGAA